LVRTEYRWRVFIASGYLRGCRSLLSTGCFFMPASCQRNFLKTPLCRLRAPAGLGRGVPKPLHGVPGRLRVLDSARMRYRVPHPGGLARHAPHGPLRCRGLGGGLRDCHHGRRDGIWRRHRRLGVHPVRLVAIRPSVSLRGTQHALLPLHVDPDLALIHSLPNSPPLFANQLRMHPRRIRASLTEPFPLRSLKKTLCPWRPSPLWHRHW
jgi:hypothetical protein